MRSSKLRFWSGMAAMGTGILWILWTVSPWTPLLVPALLLVLPAIYGLQLQRSPDIPWWSWIGCILAMGGAVASAVMVTLATAGVSATAGTLELAMVLGLVVMAGGLAILGLAAFRFKTPSRLSIPPLMLGGSIPIYAGWFWLFILQHSHPPSAIVMAWVALGVIIGIGWGYLGEALIRDAAHTSSSQAN